MAETLHIPLAVSSSRPVVPPLSLTSTTLPSPLDLGAMGPRRVLRDTGISLIGDAPWGTHFCQFYQTREDLLEVLVPYFRAGLENNEFCMWITSEPLAAAEAETALRQVLPDLDQHLESGRLEILPYGQWYTLGGSFDSQRVMDGWLGKLETALNRGFAGLRLTGNTFWLEKSDWEDFTQYESLINEVIGSYPMMALCTYSLDRCSAQEIIDVIKNHQFALINRQGRWEIIQSEQHKRLTGALGESAARLRLATEAAGLGVFEWDVASDRAVWENERMYEIFGHSPQDQIPSKRQLVREVIHPDDAASFEAALLRGMAPGRMFQTTCRLRRKNDGQWRWVEFAGSFELAPDLTPLHLVGVVADITDRKEAEERVRHQNTVLEGINRVLQEALSCETEEGLGHACLAIAQEVTRSRFGFMAELGPGGVLDNIAIGDPGWAACRMGPATANRRLATSLKIHGLYGRVITGGQGFYTNDPPSHPDSIGLPEGHPPLTAFLGVPLTHLGNIIGMIALGNKEGGYEDDDLAALEALAPAIVQVFMRKRGEAERERLLAAEQAARARADEAVSVRDEFMSVAAHELKTPVTSLRGFSQLLVREHARTGGIEPTLIAAAAARIDEQSARLTRLTERLLDISRIESGKLVISLHKTEVSSLVESVVDTIRQAHPTKSFTVWSESSIVADMDGLRVEQVLVNLLDNAAKFNPVEAPIQVEVRRNGVNQVRISVRDRGPGIPKEKLEHLFERFYQAHSHGQYGGMGIGLYVSRQIVEMHGGSIDVEQPEDGGCRFVVTLPLSHDRQT